MVDALRCVVFSRDRAMQLDAFLDSVELHAPDLFDTLVVLYRASDDSFAAGYELLRRNRDGPLWLPETSFRTDLLSASGDEEWLTFHTDDDIYFAGVPPFQLLEDEVCFTLRLGLNTTYCYPLDVAEELQGAEVSTERVRWDWRRQGPGAYSYPLALNAHVFRASQAMGWLERSRFGNPNELESNLQRFMVEVEPMMASARSSSVVSIPANLVNDVFANRHGGLHDVAELNRRFLGGERIDVAAMDFSHVDACHVEVPYAFTAHNLT